MTDYYVYAYLRKNNSKHGKAGTPYYIGKGRKQRAYHPDHSVPVPDKNRIVFLETGLTNIGAIALERRMIEWWGRIDQGGYLRNRTSGGEGNGAPKPWLSEYNRSRVHPFLGKKRPDHSYFVSEKNIEIWSSYSETGKEERQKNISEGVKEWVKKRSRKDILRSAALSAKKNKGKGWWTNGKETKKSVECPGEGWVRGRKIN